MKAILGTALLLASAAAPAVAQHRPPRIEVGQVPSTVVVTTTNWQNPPPPPPGPVYPAYPPQQPYIPYAPIPVDAAVFAGVRLEAQVGWDAFRNRDADDLVFGSGTDGRDGVTYGGELGFDAALGRRVTIGGYAGLAKTTIDPCYTVVGARTCVDPRYDLTLGGRLGLAVSPSALLYVKGGYSLSRIRVTNVDAVTPAASFRSTGNLTGFHLGAGAEAALSGRVYGKLEYVYTRFGGYDDADVGIESGDANVDRHQVKAGVGIRL